LSPYNLASTPDEQTGARGARRLLPNRPDQIGDGIWLDGQTLIAMRAFDVVRLKMGETFFDVADTKRLFSMQGQGAKNRLVEDNGRFYWVGQTWVRVDPITIRARELGPGLRIDGEFADRNVLHFKSAILGLAAISSTSSSLYQFSVDPAHPAAIRATRDVPRGQELPHDGIVEYDGHWYRFLIGDGAVMIDGRSASEVSSSTKWRLPSLERTKQLQQIRQRINNSATLGLGIMPSQGVEISRAVSSVDRMRFDLNRVGGAFSLYSNSKDAAAKEKAEHDILAEVKKFGEQKSKAQQDALATIQAALTPDQWKRVNGEL
jgi:hypothetical protein